MFGLSNGWTGAIGGAIFFLLLVGVWVLARPRMEQGGAHVPHPKHSATTRSTRPPISGTGPTARRQPRHASTTPPATSARPNSDRSQRRPVSAKHAVRLAMAAGADHLSRVTIFVSKYGSTVKPATRLSGHSGGWLVQSIDGELQTALIQHHERPRDIGHGRYRRPADWAA